MVSAQTLSSIQLSENWRQGLFVIDVGFWSHRVDNYWHGDVHRPAKVEAPTRPEAGQMDRALLTAEKLPCFLNRLVESGV